MIRRHHDVVDIEQWKSVFSLDRLRQAAWDMINEDRKARPELWPNPELAMPRCEAVTSPSHIAVIEQLREQMETELPDNCVATDVFMFGKGEPTSRESTKIGGLPYWPADKAWPASRAGRPLTFVAQFCFADSIDLTGPLPGDILLIFSDGEYLVDWFDEQEGGFQFEWMQMGDFPLIGTSQVPEPGWKIMPCFGAIHRTFDCPYPEDEDSGVEQSDSGPSAARYECSIIEGTKIGGIPLWIQYDEGLQGRFLCALGSIQPQTGIAYPYVNIEEPLARYSFEEGALTWGDVGLMNIYVAEKGLIKWSVQSY